MNNLEKSYLPVSDLDPDKQEKVKKYETKFDQVNSLRLNLAQKLMELKNLGFNLEMLPAISDKHVSSRLAELNSDEFLNLFGLSEKTIIFNKAKGEGSLEENKKAAKLKSLLREIKDLDNQLIISDGFLTQDKNFKAFYRDLIKDSGQALQGREDKDQMEIIFMGIEHYEKLLEAQIQEMNSLEEEGDSDAYRQSLADYYEYLTSYQDFINSSPEAYYAYNLKYLKNTRDSLEDGGSIIETPYVKKKIERITDEVNSGRSVFVYGETGSGKTEVARHISRKYLSREYEKRWEEGDVLAGIKAHPRPSDPEALKLWRQKKRAALEPLMISGFSGLEFDTLLGSMKIIRKEKNLDTLGQDVEKIREATEKFVNDQMEKYGQEYKGSPELDADLEMFKEGAKDMLKNPVETVPYIVGVYKAMMEGRPLIIDEVNAISHNILIVLNDLLTAKPGRSIKPMIDDMKPFEVRDGFKVIFTANWRPGKELEDERYIGRKIMDTAFMNRLALISYDYLPNNLSRDSLRNEGKDQEQIRRERRQNELFQMMVSSLIEKDLQVKVPAMNNQESNFLEHKIFDLSRAARLFQDIFSGQKVDSAVFKDVIRGSDLQNINSDVDPKDILKENVLSLRLIIPIIKQWKDQGFKKSLDYYLYKNYISRSDARPDERELLYSVLKGYGFFEDKNKWPKVSELGSMDIDSGNFKRDGQVVEIEKNDLNVKTEIISRRKLIEILFGPAPARNKVADSMFAQFQDSFQDIEKNDLIFKKDFLINFMDDIDKEFMKNSGINPEEIGSDVKSVLAN